MYQEECGSMFDEFIIFFLLFIAYSFLGWCMEVCMAFIYKRKFVNRGFLIGPYCPIYGFGVLGILFLIGNNTNDILSVFLKSILICSILEYITSYLMEKIFKARWWDYSDKRFNINGRICLETMIPFGILGTLCFYILNPFLIKVITSINTNIRLILGITLVIIFLLDNVISFNVLNKIGKNIKLQKKDNTDEIRENVINWIGKNSILYRHIKNAYPNFTIKNIINKHK